MKAYLFTVLISLMCLTFYSQGILSYFKITADDAHTERFDRIAIDIKSDQWLHTPKYIYTKWYSIGVAAYLYKDIPLNEKSNLAFAFGVGVSSDNIHHNGTFVTTTIANKKYTDLIPYDKEFKPSINKITLNYIDVPFELRFRTMNKSREERRKFNFRFYPGFKVGYMLGNHTKLVTPATKIKVYRTANVLPYRYGPTLRIGFNKISFVAFYSLTGIFESGKGVELNTFSIGISWLRF